jgi:Cdc6-like AAA superfamily ATPase
MKPRGKSKKQPPTIESCLAKLNEASFSIPLPGREDKVAQILAFIEQSYTREKWQVLLISGSPGTGKTATVTQCIRMSTHPSQADFVNCKSDKPNLISSEESSPAHLLVLDELESLPNFRQVLMNCQKYRCSLIGISNSHDETLAIAKSGRSDAISIVFESYKPDQLFQIMIERIGGLNDHIAKEAILFIAKTIGKDHGDAREVLSALNFVLSEAIRRKTDRIDIPIAKQFLDLRNAPTEEKQIMQTMPLIDQLALVAIFKTGKKWISCLQTFMKQKHISLEFNVVDIFERLETYGFVAQTRANPKCLLDRRQLDGLDEIAISLL